MPPPDDTNIETTNIETTSDAGTTTDRINSNRVPLDASFTTLPAKMFVFDLDDTLAPSKSPMPDAMATALSALLEKALVAIISGGRFEQFQAQVIARLDLPAAAYERLHLMPTCGTTYFRWEDNTWKRVYFEELSPADKAQIQDVLGAGARELNLVESKTWGETLEDRGSQITLSALGQSAPVEAKAAWDPDGVKKSKLRAYAAERLPEFEVRSGGSTSIDVTRKGIDKAYGIDKLVSYTGVSLADMLFIGDRLDVDGNDYPVLRHGVRSVQVEDWHDTVTFIERIANLPTG
jgi:HAD superfamily hydrolase (TIGR01484 family)